MWLIIQFVVWFVFILVAILCLSLYIRKLYALPFECDELHFARSADGLFLALYHLKPEKLKYEQPVMLMHGMGSNRYNLHFKKGFSLAEHLRGLGFDVWLPEMRGRARSDWPDRGYDFDDIVEFDIPAFIERIQQLTGKKEVLYLGHSMGGMALYAYLATHQDSPIKAAIAAGSPSKIGKSPLIIVAPLLRIMGVFSFWIFANLMLPLIGFFKRFRMDFNPENMDNRLICEVTANSVDRESAGLMLQFVRWIRNGKFDSMEGLDYNAEISKLDRPLLFLSGQKDRLVPPQIIKPIYENTPEQFRSWITLGSDSGLLRDYGHVDMLMGYGAAEEVYPLVSDFFVKHADAIKE